MAFIIMASLPGWPIRLPVLEHGGGVMNLTRINEQIKCFSTVLLKLVADYLDCIKTQTVYAVGCFVPQTVFLL